MGGKCSCIQTRQGLAAHTSTQNTRLVAFAKPVRLNTFKQSTRLVNTHTHTHSTQHTAHAHTQHTAHAHTITTHTITIQTHMHYDETPRRQGVVVENDASNIAQYSCRCVCFVTLSGSDAQAGQKKSRPLQKCLMFL